MHKPKLKLPSPAMIVALVALVMATTGSAVAAVTFATNAGKVDGIDAVRNGASNTRAAGKLIATKGGRSSTRGKIQAKYLELNAANVIKGQGFAQTFGRALDVNDNAVNAPEAQVVVPFYGTLSVTCADESAVVGREDPRSVITFTNQSGSFINIARQISTTSNPSTTPVIRAIANGTVEQFAISRSGIYQFVIERAHSSLVVNGVVRQDGGGTPAAQCLSYGQALRVG